jgi:catechol-2,3-dioxygenase
VARALVGASDHGTTEARYAKDPDGIEFEVSRLVPLAQVTEQMREEIVARPLNLPAEIDRWGADLVGMS